MMPTDLGRASIASGYTPDAFGALPRSPQPPKGEKGKAERKAGQKLLRSKQKRPPTPKEPLKTAKQEKESGSQAPTLAHKRPQCGRLTAGKGVSEKLFERAVWVKKLGNPVMPKV